MASTFDIASQNSVGVLNQFSNGASISGNGSFVTFVSFDAISGYNQVYVKNLTTSALTLASSAAGSSTPGNNTSYYPAISADGSVVGFDSYASNLVAGSPVGLDEVYVKNIQTGGMTLASQTQGGTIANGQSEYAALSANGTLVAFDSNASNLGLGATGAFKEVYVKNLTSGALALASQTATGTQANGSTLSNSISADGNVVVFQSTATDLGSSSGTTEVYAKNETTLALSIVSSASDGTVANASSTQGSVSGDGTLVGFESNATNLVPGATGGNSEAYLKNLTTGAISLISSKADGTIANGNSYVPIISADGHFALFESTATNLDPAATTGTQQVYVKNLQTGALTLLSKTAAGLAGNLSSFISYANEQTFSADDSRIVFTTYATNLGAPVGNSVVLRDTTTGPALALNPVTSDDIVNATELAAPVTFAGTSDAIGGTVQVSIDTAGNSIGSATVKADGTWSFTANVSGLAPGAHTEIATAQGTSYLPTTTNQSFTVDTTPPTVLFNTPVTFTDAHTGTISGTVSDPSSAVTGVQVTVNGTAFAATLNGTDWTLAGVHFGSGFQNISATATDAAGNTSAPTPAPFSLETGLKGPFSADEEDFDSMGRLAGETFTKSNGKVYLADTVTNLPNGDQLIDYSAGTFFAKQNYFNKSDLTTADDHTKVETFYNNDGTHTITGYVSGVQIKSIHDDTMTGGGKHDTFVFKPHFGQDLITDFIVSGSGHDTLSLASSEFSSIAQVLSHTQDVNGNAEIRVSPHDTITLQNVTTADLKAHQTDIKLHA